MSFHQSASSYDSSSRLYLTTAVAVLAFAIVGVFGAILNRSGAAAQADVVMIDLRK